MKPRVLVAGEVGDLLHVAFDGADVVLEADLGKATKELKGADAVVLGLTDKNAEQAGELLVTISESYGGLPIALAAPRATLKVLGEYYLKFPQIAPLIETEGLREEAAKKHAKQLLARVGEANAEEADDDLVFGTYFTIATRAADYRDQRSLSLVSPSMQEFLDDLRDAVTAMRRPARRVIGPESDELSMPPIPWDPNERSTGMENPDTWTATAKHLPNLRAVLDNANHKNAQRLLRSDGSKASEAAIRAFDKPPLLLLEGDSGTGKTMVAALVRDLLKSQAGDEFGGEMPFVEINCGGMTIDNFDHRMHGSAAGIFTDARNVGQLVRAAYGVAFFDELGDLSYEAQTRLLMYLEDGKVAPEGATPFFGFTRVVAATNRDLGQMIREGTFRHDLLARFSKRVRLPSLAERGPDDLERLIDFVALNPSVNPSQDARFVPRMSADAVAVLKEHSYADGNFRELESVVHWAMDRARRARSKRVEKEHVLSNPNFGSHATGKSRATVRKRSE